ncbi:4Fe-4S dicluster domain-containing protein [Pseudodesulfovibrio sp. JC047]|uniref:4Fe-4S dicluster domain-containing protein n=1 Tax=Pseudodesulfovibrio sp. JC047 TaxID=2683199 RepID=UPI0013D2A411|nr:4Fe-4S binding protein [Pseudodesulfovibrio sp. JC047]NDV18724.1 4Fe-4S dicluster domain-containing protein [Pseudodesulfovibrio sp. JC047]
MARKDKGKNKVTVYPDWCKGCGICVEFCPGNVLELNDQGKSSVVREENCIRCGFCELHCPDFAIVVKDKDPESDQKVDRTVMSKDVTQNESEGK